MEDLTPKYPLPPAEQEILVPPLPTDPGAAPMGGFQASPGALHQGQFTINGAAEQILMGSATDPTTGMGIFIGRNASDGTYQFRVGDPANYNYLAWDNTFLKIFGLLQQGNYYVIGSASDGSNTTLVNAGFVTRSLLTTLLAVTSASNDTAALRSLISASGTLFDTVTFANTIIKFAFSMYAPFTGTNADVRAFGGIIHSASVPSNDPIVTSKAMTQSHIGFYVEDGASGLPTIYATCADGATQTITSLGTQSQTTSHKYRFEKNGTTVKYYIDDVLKATHSTHVPTSSSETYYITFKIGNNASAKDANIQIGNNYQLLII